MSIEIPSRHELGDNVVVVFPNCGRLINGIVSGIKFTNRGKVLYDITLQTLIFECKNEAVLTDIDSYYVKSIFDILIEQGPIE